MVTNDIKGFNKIALTVLGWSSAIFIVVMWRSGGNIPAICLMGGIPLGVGLLWGSVHLHAAAQVDRRALTLAKVVPQGKTSATRRAAVEHQNLIRMPLASANRAHRPVSAPIAAHRSVSRVIPAPITNMHDTNAVMNSPYMDPPGESIEAPAMFTLEEDHSSPGFDFLDEMNYLYKPSSGRDRQTLGMDTNHARPELSGDTEEFVSKKREITRINIDFGDDT